MKFVVVGYGRFGHIAADRLSNAFPNRSLIIVDHDSARLPRESNRLLVVPGDATSFLLSSNLLEPEDMVVPMVPFHLAASYVIEKAPGAHEITMPEALLTLVPNALRTSASNLLASKADFLCPDDCAEGEFCTVTGLRTEPLHRALEQISIPGFTMIVQRSHQILPGVGGYPMHDLVRIAAQLVRGRYILATSCKCHSVLTAIWKE